MTRDEIAKLAKQYAEEVVNQAHYWHDDGYGRQLLQVSRGDLLTDIAYAIRQALIIAQGGVVPDEKGTPT